MYEEDLKADISSVVDFINIKSLPEMISVFLHDNGCKKYSNLRKFYSGMLDSFGEDIKNSYLNRILKYLSSDKPSDIALIDGINNGVYDKELLDFTNKLVKEINKIENYESLYELLNKKINFVFFSSDDEFIAVKDYHNNKDYVSFVFNLFKHSFRTYQKSLPAIMGRSLYTQSRTMYSGLSGHIRFLNASSSIGNDDATLELYSILFYKDHDTAVRIITRSKDNEAVLWSVAFNLENNFLNEETVQIVKNRFNYIYNMKDEFIDKITVTDKAKKTLNEESLLFAYRMYYYCYNEYHFTKSGNSLGKLLIFGAVSYDNDKEKSIALGKDFLKKEIKLGNINAITNLAVFLYDNPSDKDYDYKKIKKWFEISASFGDMEGNYYYGRMLYDEGKYDRSFKYLLYASERKCPEAMELLGEYYELKDDVDNAIKYYKMAIMNKYYDAAYKVALLYFNLKNIQTESCEVLEEMGIDYLKKYYNLFSDCVKQKAELLIEKKF